MTRNTTDPSTPTLLEAASDLLATIFFAFWRPAELAGQPAIWQWRKLAFLDLLRPLERLVRRILLIEAFGLIATLLPESHSRPARARHRRHTVELDPDNPASWPVRFRILCERTPRRGNRRPAKLVASDPHFPVPPRYARKLHNPWPLALRLEAVARILSDPAPHIRRLAFRLRRAARRATLFAILPPGGRGPRLLSDAMQLSATRLAVRSAAHWDPG
jgi:hypothetical protein